MSKYGDVKFDGLKQFANEIKSLEKNKDQFIEQCAKELAARLLALVIKRTPRGDYSRTVTVVAKRNSKNHKKGETYTKKVNTSGKAGGTLIRGWTGGQNSDAKSYANSLNVQHSGNVYKIEIINPVEYASYVEYGHRTRNHKGWVEGKFMMTISEQELQTIAPKVLEAKLRKYMENMEIK